jgi:hypothetical protein
MFFILFSTVTVLFPPPKTVKSDICIQIPYFIFVITFKIREVTFLLHVMFGQTGETHFGFTVVGPWMEFSESRIRLQEKFFSLDMLKR